MRAVNFWFFGFAFVLVAVLVSAVRRGRMTFYGQPLDRSVAPSGFWAVIAVLGFGAIVCVSIAALS